MSAAGWPLMGAWAFLVIHERAGGTWAIYPHGVGELGVRLENADAVRVAEAILAGAR